MGRREGKFGPVWAAGKKRGKEKETWAGPKGKREKEMGLHFLL